MEWVTTSTLLHSLRDLRNGPAWDGFVRRFRAPIVEFARRLGLAPEDAEDMAQETLTAFAELLREGRYERERGRLSSWLFGIAYRQALRHRRRSLRFGSRSHVTVPMEEGEARNLWEESWDRLFLEACIERARAECTAESFRSFELVVVEGRTPAEAAALLACPVKRVYNDKHRVLTRIRELRAEMEGGSDIVGS